MATDTPGETHVSWQVDGIDVNASLTRPEGEGPFPAVIMIAGSGPTDRNWNTPVLPGTNGSAALLARVLTDLGYVTLRYDKRPSGPHIQENSAKLAGKISMQGHVDEVAGGVVLLAGRRDVDPARIVALTNSEGCLHALNYQIQAPDLRFAGLVLTSAPARAVGAVAHAQIEAQLKPLPGGAEWLAAYDETMADFVAGRAVSVDENWPEGLRLAVLGITSPMNQPFARELWVTSAADLLAQVSVPVLIVIGKKDVQVDWQADGAVFEAVARSRPGITIAYVDGADHVLKHEPRDRSELTAAAAVTYNSEGRALDESVVATITTWLAAH